MQQHFSTCNATMLRCKLKKKVARVFSKPLLTLLTLYKYVAQSVERWSSDPGSRIQFPAGGLGVAFFATGPGWVLQCITFSH